jgi:hypothetical protein
MSYKNEMACGVVLFGLHMLGGIVACTGLFLVILMNGQELQGMGDSRIIGYLIICAGLCLSIAGLLLMRSLKDRGLRPKGWE